MKTFDFYSRRVVGYPLVFVGYLITVFAGWMIKSGAWLMDHEDLIERAE